MVLIGPFLKNDVRFVHEQYGTPSNRELEYYSQSLLDVLLVSKLANVDFKQRFLCVFGQAF